MLWNLFIHIIGGAVGYKIFSFQAPGLFYCLAITIVIQGLDMFRYNFNMRKRAPPFARENMKGAVYLYKLAQIYVVKVLFYGLVTLVTSSIMHKILA